MKLYLINVTVPAAGGGEVTLRTFVGTKGGVNAKRKELAELYDVHWKNDTDSTEVEVPTNKEGLIAYLNELVAPPAAGEEEEQP